MGFFRSPVAEVDHLACGSTARSQFLVNLCEALTQLRPLALALADGQDLDELRTGRLAGQNVVCQLPVAGPQSPAFTITDGEPFMKVREALQQRLQGEEIELG